MWTIIFFTSWQCSSFVMGNDDWLSHLSDESQPKCEKVPLIIKKWKTHFYITFNFWWLAKWSKQQKSTEMQKKTQVIKKWNAWFWITFNFWWSAKWSEWWTLTETKKRPPNSLKNKMLIFGLCSISDDWLSNLSDERRPKCKKRKKGPWCHRKLNGHFWIMFNFWWSAKWSTKVDWNVKKTPKSSKNGMLGFGLHSTFDDQPSNLSKKCQLKCKKKK